MEHGLGEIFHFPYARHVIVRTRRKEFRIRLVFELVDFVLVALEFSDGSGFTDTFDVDDAVRATGSEKVMFQPFNVQATI